MSGPWPFLHVFDGKTHEEERRGDRWALSCGFLYITTESSFREAWAKE